MATACGEDTGDTLMVLTTPTENLVQNVTHGFT